MDTEIRRTLELPRNTGSADLSAVIRGDLDSGFAGIAGSVRRRFDGDSAGFLRGSFGRSWDSERSALDWEILAGIRGFF